ncbi:hypothetical protein L1999_09625 [Neobacillus drentensis]|uniref:hypothetical protein n=1 Tax=Neobacillus drentensis TaxID=220684 RepID=UPI001F36908C|nr:hypothetical protein [Neobacillus drentensis]ULT58761.1 hypothetical protein L1999_09625 [Neobacillus drentensis]
MCQKPMKFTLHQMEMERKAAIKRENQSQSFFRKLFNTLSVGKKSKDLVKGGAKND